MDNLSIIIPSFRTPSYVEYLIASFLKFKPKSLNLEIIVVENSSNDYEARLKNTYKDLIFIQNPTKAKVSVANSEGIEVGKRFVTSPYTFICHSDTCVTSTDFFDSLFSKIKEGYELVGTRFDNNPERIKAIHISGLMIKSSILQKVNSAPQDGPTFPIGRLDVGDAYTKHFREESKEYFCFKNTHNFSDISLSSDDPFVQLNPDFSGDRCIGNSGKIIFIHMGRGSSTRTNSRSWGQVCGKILEQ